MGLLDGRVALVTGAAQGLGAAFCEALAAEGATVVGCDVRPEVETLPERLPRAEGLTADVSRADDVRRVVEHARSRGTVGVLVNNAGAFTTSHPKDPIAKAQDDFETVIGTNLRGTFLFGRAVATVMLEQGEGGDIVNVSTDHVLPPPGRPTGGGPAMDVYDASKWALRGLTEAWALALAKRRIRVNELCMGATDTAMLRGFYRGDPPAEEVAGWMQPAEIAEVLIALLREGPEGRTGEQIPLWAGHPVELPARG